jgi:hypothetical protein
MHERKDYLENQLALLGQFIATIFNNKNNNKTEDLIQNIDTYGEMHLSKSMVSLINEQLEMPDKTIIGTKKDLVELEIGAKLLIEKYRLFLQLSQPFSAEKARKKSLQILQLIKMIDSTYSIEREKLIKELQNNIN